LLVFPPSAGQRVPVERLLPPGAVHEVVLSAGATEAIAVASQPSAGPIELEEIRSFIEDIETNVVFLDLINHAGHGLATVEVEARLKDVPGSTRVHFSGDPPSGAAEFILPLTKYLANRVVQFRVTKSFTASAAQVTPWIDWDLERSGNVVSLTWELVQ
jgi:hypothetical protein